MLKRLFCFVFLLAGLSAFSQSTIKTMFYNLLEFPEALPANRSIILRNIIDEYEPDIFMVCELQSEEGADEILNFSLNDEAIQFERPEYFENQSGFADLQQLIFFRKSKFTFIDSEIITTNIRDINHYTLQVNTADAETNPLYIEFFVTHLKASDGGENEIKRLQMVQKFTNSLETIEPNSFVIFAGDLNLYSSTEPAYQELLDPTNAITLKDPVDTPGLWHNNVNFKSVHTQSTRLSSGPFDAGAGGGMDDRFDFILISENMLDNPTLQYVENTYQAFGNNGNCFNDSVNSTDCTGDFSEELRNNLYNMSDHLPVVLQLKTNKEIILKQTDFEIASSTITLENTVVKHTLRIHLNNNISEKRRLLIYNLLGQKVYEETVNGTINTLDIQLSHLSNGIYYLHSNFQSNPLKFIKSS